MDVMGFDFGMEQVFLAITLAGLAAIQSIFGMGILVFGTPTLLLAGYTFPEALGLLLPGSFLLSLAQVASQRSKERPPISKSLWVICLPAIGVGLAVTVNTVAYEEIYLMIAAALVFSALLRFSVRARKIFRGYIQGNLKVFHFVMGVLHGMTNMGGALLGIMASTVHSNKSNARYVTAYYYLFFVMIQFFVLGASVGVDIFSLGIIFAPIPLAVFYIFGNRIFHHLGNEFFNKAMTGFLLAYAVTLILKSFSFL